MRDEKFLYETRMLINVVGPSLGTRRKVDVLQNQKHNEMLF